MLTLNHDIRTAKIGSDAAFMYALATRVMEGKQSGNNIAKIIAANGKLERDANAALIKRTKNYDVELAKQPLAICVTFERVTEQQRIQDTWVATT